MRLHHLNSHELVGGGGHEKSNGPSLSTLGSGNNYIVIGDFNSFRFLGDTCTGWGTPVQGVPKKAPPLEITLVRYYIPLGNEGTRKFLNLESLKCHFLDFGEVLTEF